MTRVSRSFSAPRPEPSPPARSLSLAGMELAFLVTGDETRGAWSLVEIRLSAGYAGLPTHRHPRTEQRFWVLEGQATLTRDGTARTIPAGASAVVPAGAWHAVSNPSSRPARLLLYLEPAGLEGFFVERAGADDAPDLAGIARRYDTFFLSDGR